MNSRQINGLIAKRFAAPEWATLFEVRDSTGTRGAGQSLDAYTARLWGTGVRTISFEVKVSRSDFLREIKDPDKRKFAERVGSECYFVVPHGLVKVDEVPEGWGLFMASKKGDKLIRKKIAMQRAVDPPFAFTLSLMRRISTQGEEGMAAVKWKHDGKELSDEAMKEVCRAFSIACQTRESFDLIAAKRQVAQMTKTHEAYAELANLLGDEIGVNPRWAPLGNVKAALHQLRTSGMSEGKRRSLETLSEVMRRGLAIVDELIAPTVPTVPAVQLDDEGEPTATTTQEVSDE